MRRDGAVALMLAALVVGCGGEPESPAPSIPTPLAPEAQAAAKAGSVGRRAKKLRPRTVPVPEPSHDVVVD